MSDITELARITYTMSAPVAACLNRDLTPREPQIGIDPTTPYFNGGTRLGNPQIAGRSSQGNGQHESRSRAIRL